MDANEPFPALPREPGLSPTFGSIQLCTARRLSISQIQQCWALLIKLYTLRETVSFAYIRSRIQHDDEIDRCSLSTTLARIISYQATPPTPGPEMVYKGWKPQTPRAVEREQVNTALLHCRGIKEVGDGWSLNDVRKWTTANEQMQQASLQLISVASTEPGLILQYRTDCFPPRYAESIAHTFQEIVTARQNGTVDSATWSNIALNASREHLLKWNPSNTISCTTSLHGLVRQTVLCKPDAEAVYSWDGQFSYRQLDGLSSDLAQQLMDAGVTKETYVAFAFEKSRWAIVAMLGILKAGAAFVALDCTQPVERLGEMLRMLSCTIMVTSKLQVSRLSSLATQAIVIPPEVAANGPNPQPPSYTTEPDVGPDDAALVLFTSGSTGKPKAMVHEHRSISSHALALGEGMRYRNARVLQFSAYIWDVAIMDIFITLIFGGCVCVPSEEDRVNDIGAFIRLSKADLALITPSYSRSIDPESVPSLKTLALAGECMTQEDVKRWAGRVTLMNAYGPAEVGGCTLNASVTGEQRPENIGCALRNSPCWLVNPDDVNQLVPIGATGELVVGGPNLAREYLHQPELTERLFVVDPAWSVEMGLEHRRFYRTGDLLAYDLKAFDGSMNFMGRKDDQMKVRGQRIEPGEIEYHLSRVPGIKKAIVTIPKNGLWEGELVAVVLTDGCEADSCTQDPLRMLPAEKLPVGIIQDRLSKCVPTYMVPTACVILSHFPLTPSMKINRREVKAWLEKTDRRSTNGAKEWTPPSNATPLGKSEKTAWIISSIVEKTIRCQNADRPVVLAGYDFSFQDAGLNSIQMITLFSTLRKLFGDLVSLPALLRMRLTVRNLAKLVDSPGNSKNDSNGATWALVQGESRTISQELLKNLHGQINLPRPVKIVTILNVFLTGASGYLGMQILRHLLCQSNVHVYVHMRDAGERRGEGLIRKTAIMQGWWDEPFSSRYTVWPGDLSKKNLGLGKSHLAMLHGQGPVNFVVNAAIHCGAVVHYTLDYESLRQANVHSTTTLLAATAKSRFFSSLVFISGGRTPRHQDKPEQPEDLEKSLWNGYSQSKYVAERIISASSVDPVFTGKRLCTVSPGYIIGSAMDGRANTRDFIWKMIAGCIEIGAYNQDEVDRWLFICGVDVVSRVAAGHLLRRGTRVQTGQQYPITEGVQFRTLWGILEEKFGYRLDKLPGEEWLSKLKAVVMKVGESHPLFPLLPALETNGRNLGASHIPGKEDPGVVEALCQNIKYLSRTGFFPKPSSAPAAR